MTISAGLHDRYGSEVDVDWWRGIELSHPQAGTLYLTDAHENQSGQIDGVLRAFQAIPFLFQLPRRDAEGLQQLSLQIDAIGREILDYLDAALESPERIRCRFGEWLYHTTEQQWIPLLEMSLTDIAATETAVAATATAADTLNRAFPGPVYRADTYPGLRRR